MPAVKITLAGWYLLTGLDRLVRDLAPLTELDHETQITIDLRRLAFIGPTCLAVLVAVLKSAQEQGFNAPGSQILPPTSALTRTYLFRMDLIRQVAGDDVPEEFERHETVGFRPCRHFIGGVDAVAVAGDLATAIAERVLMDDVAQVALYVGLSELAENVVYHADTQLGGYVAAQGWRRRPEIELAIVDLGVGIRASLAKNAAYADIATDLDAIATAIQPAVTSRPGQNRGWGLAFVRGLLQGNGGNIVIRSGDAELYTGAADLGHTFGYSFPGTIVAMTVRTDRPLDQHDGWRAISEAERGV